MWLSRESKVQLRRSWREWISIIWAIFYKSIYYLANLEAMNSCLCHSELAKYWEGWKNWGGLDYALNKCGRSLDLPFGVRSEHFQVGILLIKRFLNVWFLHSFIALAYQIDKLFWLPAQTPKFDCGANKLKISIYADKYDALSSLSSLNFGKCHWVSSSLICFIGFYSI